MNRIFAKAVVGFFVIIGFGTGCSTSPRAVDVGSKGLFQKDAQSQSMTVTSGTMPISLPPTVTSKSESGFMWPVKEGKVSSFFGKRKRDFHEGIDIRANRGNPIYAAKAGEVIYNSRKIRGYGNMIVIKHDDGMATVYAHNRKNLVKHGEKVKQGQLIGLIGSTGKSTGPHLHFEIRKGELAQDPLLYLPQVRSPAMAVK